MASNDKANTRERANATQTVTFIVPSDSSSEEGPQKVAVESAESTFQGPTDGRRYERYRVLGQGGMGTVVLVRDKTVGRSVALKQLNDDVAIDSDSVVRFAREARVQGQLEHPAIVPVYDVGTGVDGKPFFTMKRVRGQSLAEVLEQLAEGKPSTFSRRKLLSAFSQLCAAAHYAHERGVVHRDIKPLNVMLGSYGEVYLLDWGVAKVAGEKSERHPSDENIDAKLGMHTGFGSVMGTLTTMAPEQAVGGEVDARADVYALGAVLFEILTLQHFHPRGDYEDVLKQITTGVEARPSVRMPDAEVPPELEDLCVRSTKLQPADRIASAMILRDAIEAYLDGDRDVELRKESARKHAEAAEAAAAQDIDQEHVRADALNEVGKALALDPGNKSALGTLVKLLTTPPKVMPREIVTEHEEALKKNLRRAGIVCVAVYIYISLNALSTWTLGIQNQTIFLTAHVLWGFALISSFVTVFRPSYKALLATFFLGVMTSTFITAVYGPYLIVATLITMHAVLFAFVRDWKPRIMVIVTASIAWTIAVFGEAGGLFPETVRFVNGDMVLHSTAIGLPPKVTTVYLWFIVLSTIILPSVVVGALRTAYHKSELAMRLQSWQLRRLVSDSNKKK